MIAGEQNSTHQLCPGHQLCPASNEVRASAKFAKEATSSSKDQFDISGLDEDSVTAAFVRGSQSVVLLANREIFF